MLDQGSPNIIAQNHLWGDWAKASLPQPLSVCIFKICTGCTKCSKFLCVQPANFLARFRLKKRDGHHLSRLVVCTSWTALSQGAFQVIVSAVLLMSMASCRQEHTSSALCACQWATNRRAGPGEFQLLYGTRRAAATHVGMSSDCSKLGHVVW